MPSITSYPPYVFILTNRKVQLRINLQILTVKCNHRCDHFYFISQPEYATIEVGELQFALAERRVFLRADEVEITLKEIKLLHTLIEQSNRAFARDELLTLVWGDNYYGSDRAIDDLVKRLRRKIKHLPIDTVWGHGYRLRMERTEQ
ncbi:winged helix-turn-helix domain-containing protein [Paenibacillus sp. MCAF9]